MAAICLSGCGGGPGSPASKFFGSAGGLFGGPKTMALAPIIGAPSKIGDEMTQALVQAGQAHGLTLVPNGENAPRTIRGYLVATKEGRGASISYIWDVTDSSGKRVNRIAGQQDVSRRGSDAWSGVTSADLSQIAEKTAAALAGDRVRGAGEPPAAAAAPEPARTAATAPPPPTRAPAAAPAATPTASSSSGGIGGFFSRTFGFGSSKTTPEPEPAVAAAAPSTGPVYTYVAPVAGAPGDGRTSLSAALRSHLAANGAKLASSPSSHTYTVHGEVSLTDAGAGKQTIRIDWRVDDPDGRRLGTVTQQNTIAKGSLSGRWGPIADAAAGAATGGILKLIPQSRG